MGYPNKDKIVLTQHPAKKYIDNFTEFIDWFIVTLLSLLVIGLVKRGGYGSYFFLICILGLIVIIVLDSANRHTNRGRKDIIHSEGISFIRRKYPWCREIEQLLIWDGIQNIKAIRTPTGKIREIEITVRDVKGILKKKHSLLPYGDLDEVLNIISKHISRELIIVE